MSKIKSSISIDMWITAMSLFLIGIAGLVIIYTHVQKSKTIIRNNYSELTNYKKTNLPDGGQGETISQPYNDLKITVSDICTGREKLVFEKDKQVTICTMSLNEHIQTGINLKEDEELVVLESASRVDKYFVSIVKIVPNQVAADYFPQKSFTVDVPFSSRDRVVLKEVDVHVIIEECGFYDSNKARVYSWFCGGEGASTNSGLPLTIFHIGTKEETIIDEKIFGHGDDGYNTRLWFSDYGDTLWVRNSGLGVGTEIIVFDLTKEKLHPLRYQLSE